MKGAAHAHAAYDRPTVISYVAAAPRACYRFYGGRFNARAKTIPTLYSLAACCDIGRHRGLCRAGRGAVHATRAEAGRHRRSWRALNKASPSRCPPTATPPSWAGLTTTGASGRRGSSPAAAVSGPSRAASWSAPAQLETPQQGSPSRCPPTATPPSWAGLATTGHRGGVGLHPQRRRLDPAGQQAGRHGRGWNRRQGFSVALSADGNTAIVGGPCDNSTSGRRGSSPAAAVSGPSRAASWSAPAQLEPPSKASPSRCRPTATPPSWAGLATTADAGAAWVFTRSGGVWTQQGSKLVGTGAVGNARTRLLRRAVCRRQHRHRGRA